MATVMSYGIWGGTGAFVGGVTGVAMCYGISSRKKSETPSSGTSGVADRFGIIDSAYSNILKDEELYEIITNISTIKINHQKEYDKICESVNNLSAILEFVEERGGNARQILKANRLATEAKTVLAFLRDNISSQNRGVWEDNQSKLHTAITDRLQGIANSN